jgi:hypothetical protein
LSVPPSRLASRVAPGIGWGLPTQPSVLALIKKRVGGVSGRGWLGPGYASVGFSVRSVRGGKVARVLVRSGRAHAVKGALETCPMS